MAEGDDAVPQLPGACVTLHSANLAFEDPESEARSLKPVRWRCRRGMKELDVLLERYFDNQFGASMESEKAAFLTLLSMPDPVLMDFVMGRQQPKDAGIKDVVFKICQPKT